MRFTGTLAQFESLESTIKKLILFNGPIAFLYISGLGVHHLHRFEAVLYRLNCYVPRNF